MRINVAIPEAHVEAPVLDAALEGVTRLNESLLQRGEVPTFERGLRQHSIRWRPEPPGAEHFDHAKTVIARRWGDCDDLAPWHAASLRHTGEDPNASAIVKRSGPNTWHAVVQRGDGSIDDPSRRAGMGRNHGIHGAVLPLMLPPQAIGGSGVGAYIIRPQIAVRPVRGAFQARADIPWHWREHLEDEPTPTDYAMTSLHTAPVAHTALVGAIEGACEIGLAAGIAHPDHIDRLCALADACEGMQFDELAHIYGEEHAEAAEQIVGSFFGSLAHIAKGALKPLSKAVQFVPGIGPIASSAMDLAQQALPSGGGGPSAATQQYLQHGPAAGPMFPGGAAALAPHSGRICIPATFE